MKNLIESLKRLVEKVDWASVCTFVSCAGVVGTGVSAAIGGVKLAKDYNPDDEFEDKAKAVLKDEWPAIVLGVGTIGLDILGRYLYKREIASLLELGAMAGVIAGQLDNYRDEVASEYGFEAEERIRRRVNARFYSEDEDGIEERAYTFYEPVTKTYFNTTVGNLHKSKNKLNTMLYIDPFYHGQASVSDFLTFAHSTKFRNERTESAGWYVPFIKGYMDFGWRIDFTLDSKVDRMGKRYWIIVWNTGGEPFADIELEKWKRRDQEEYM